MVGETRVQGTLFAWGKDFLPSEPNIEREWGGGEWERATDILFIVVNEY
jgi:hypothetical protein